jgi:hypothetical protein
MIYGLALVSYLAGGCCVWSLGYGVEHHRGTALIALFAILVTVNGVCLLANIRTFHRRMESRR